MSKQEQGLFNHWRQDLPASVVVFLVALPLCLGIALASGAPLFAGLISGIVGGIVVGSLSRSPLSVSGPAAGLAVVVLGAIQSLPSYQAFLLAVVLAGLFQILLGVARAGTVSNYIPSAVIKGMLAAIGIILVLKQIPHALGYDADYEGDQSFWQDDGYNTFSELIHLFNEALSPGAIIISVLSLIFLFWWDSGRVKKSPWLKEVPSSLIVVVFGVLASFLFKQFIPGLAISSEHMVNVPVAGSAAKFFSQFTLPDFSQIGNQDVWLAGLTLSLVASVETLLNVEAVDKLDPLRRITPPNRELLAQGAGNMVSGLLGGLPITSVIVRSSANVNSGAVSRLSAIAHGLLLLVSVAAIPFVLNQIPLSALAAILIAIGYKLAKPQIFLRKYQKGLAHFIPFVVTILAILFTDLLIGVCIGLVVGAFFVIRQNYHSAISLFQDGNNYLLRFKKDLSFIHKLELKRYLSQIPEQSSVLIDLSRVSFVDLDNAEIINDFIATAKDKGIQISIKRLAYAPNFLIEEPTES
ncbi:MAG: SulP family inorganic anion transporter [Phaeodactylibacter sp.]|nr:SulP family inorganic anion transporter [Phaeodactylibacter sp.]MCB9301827.1 SulP family inorganic anion transporter [Lewinellaceae bacterium]